MEKYSIMPMTEEDYDEVRALWMTIRGFGIRALDDSREDVQRFIRRNPTTSVVARYDGKIVMCQRMPDIFADAMGNQMYMALLDTEDDVREFVTFVLDEQAKLIMPTLYV